MPPVGFEPTISAGERPKTNALDRAATGTGKMVQVVESKTQLIRWWSVLLLRQHVSALAFGHHQVSNCVLKETIQCSIYIAHNIQRDLVDGIDIVLVIKYSTTLLVVFLTLLPVPSYCT
jgi:hypothetical protein